MGKVETVQIPAFDDDGPGYEQDFCAWLEEQGRRLRLLRIPGLDTEALAEEIEGLSRSDRRALASHVRLLLSHLLKWRYQPARSGRSWRSTIFVQRQDIGQLLADSPSLRPSLGQVIAAQYPAALLQAAAETGLAEASFPHECKWTAEELLSPAFLPGPAEP